jgi:hypothetical protein
MLDECLVECLKVVGLGHKVGLAADLYNRAALAVGSYQRSDQTIVGAAVCLLGGAGKALLAEEIDSGFDIALCLYKGAFAVHKACASAGA